MSTPTVSRRDHIKQLAIPAGTLFAQLSLLQPSEAGYPAEGAIQRTFAKLSAGRMMDPSQGNAWCVIQSKLHSGLYVQALIPSRADRIHLEAVSERFVPCWSQLISSRQTALLSALGFEPPSGGSPNYSHLIPGADRESVALAARIAASTLHDVYGVRSPAEAEATFWLPGGPSEIFDL
jgi:hypothetical protein